MSSLIAGVVDGIQVRERRQYDGREDPEGPLLIAVEGKVYNCWTGRHFYLPGAEYAIFAGRDATRLLARSKLEEESEDEAQKPLTVAERAALSTWVWTFDTNYKVVGTFAGDETGAALPNEEPPPVATEL